MPSDAKPVEMESPPTDDMKKPILKSPLSELGADVPKAWIKKPSFSSANNKPTPDEPGEDKAQRRKSEIDDDTL